MSEIKTFSELCLHDKIFYVTRDYHSQLGISGIKADDEQICKTILSFSNSDFDDVSVPDDESVYEDEESEIKYTTDKSVYQKWITPFIEKKIENKEKRIQEIQLEIQELKESITPQS